MDELHNEPYTAIELILRAKELALGEPSYESANKIAIGLDEALRLLGYTYCEECGELRDCSTQYGDVKDHETGADDSLTLCSDCWGKLDD